MSIRTRLLLLILFATLLPALVGGISFLRQREAQIADAERELANATRQVAQALTDAVRSTAQLHYGLSRARDLETQDRVACSNFLAEVLKEHPQYTGILTIKPDGQLHCDSLRTGRILNLTDRQYFQRAMRAKNPLAVEAVFGRLTGLGVLQVAYGVRGAQGETQFVLLASLDLEKYMRARLQALPVGNTRIALMDRDGRILTWHPDDARMRGTLIVDSPLFRLARDGSEAAVRADLDIDGVSRIWATSTLPEFEEAGLHVLVGVSKNDLLVAANRNLNQALATLAVVWLLIFAGAWALAELAIRRPTARVIAAVSRFAGGDVDARIGSPYPRGEIGDLMVELDHAFGLMNSQQASIHQLNMDLEYRVAERTAQLEVTVRELDGFTYSVSHDLRAPLRAIDGFASLLLKDYADRLDAEARRRIDTICANSRSMGKLIDDLLEFSRLGRGALATVAIDMHGLACAVLEEIREQGETLPHITIGALPPARGDAALIKQVWVNLLRNALKFSSKRAQPVVEISGFENADECVYSVRDNGAGFDMRYYHKLFGVFQRLHGKAEFSGTGVGLALVQRVVSRHGGRAWAEGALEAGATFYFSLPRKEESPPPADSVAARE